MTIGGSIALIVLGAIFRFAINWSSAFVNLQVIGVILMIGGAIGLIISLWFLMRRRSAVPPPPPPDDVYHERRYTESSGRYNEPPY